MKKLFFGISVVIALTSVQACNNRAKNAAEDDEDSISSADSINAVNSPDKISAPADSIDTRFVVGAVRACITEAALGKLATKNAQNKLVKNFGALMVKDIAKAEKRLLALSKNKRIVLPTAPDAAQQKTIDRFAKKSGKDFDMAYVNYMIADHKTYIDIFGNASRNSADHDIKGFATKSLRVLKNHLDAINTIHDNIAH